jgi:hypothetical protein
MRLSNTAKPTTELLPNLKLPATLPPSYRTLTTGRERGGRGGKRTMWTIKAPAEVVRELYPSSLQVSGPSPTAHDWRC